LRRVFGQDAALYDRARPGYPAQLFADLVEFTDLTPASRVLEIGCGTGQATVPLARLGCSVTAVELSAELAAVARHNLRDFPDATVEVAPFETWAAPVTPFDLVVSATAFHWVDPEVRVGKAADLLRPGGALAVAHSEHVAGGTEGFFAEVQECYERFDPRTPAGLRLPRAADISIDSEELDRSHRFGPAWFRRYEWEQDYTTGQYLELLMTYSGTRSLDPAAREGLLDCIRGLIDRGYGGRISKRYLTWVVAAHRTVSGR
jgi:SAM-dependent methyltransferase